MVTNLTQRLCKFIIITGEEKCTFEHEAVDRAHQGRGLGPVTLLEEHEVAVGSDCSEDTNMCLQVVT